MTFVHVRGIIFDFDGVLVDSEPIRFKAGARALEEIGVCLTWERFLNVWLGRTDQKESLSEPVPTRFTTPGYLGLFSDEVTVRGRICAEGLTSESSPGVRAVTGAIGRPGRLGSSGSTWE